MNAIGYMRLSEKDQSNSLEDQEARIRAYCHRNNLELTALFTDNGECSDSFDRADFKALERFIREHKGKNQYLIVKDHDRFSRNLPEALMKIPELERKFGIKVLETEEPVDLDPDDPDVFIQRAMKYLFANNELLRIRKRTRQGMRFALESGRYVNKAPFGYKNARDADDRGIIVVDKERAPVIQTIYRDYLAGMPIHVIYKDAIRNGYNVRGNSAIQKALGNCVYAGLIKVPGDRKTPERYVKGRHPGLVSEADFWLVQELLGNKRPSKVQPQEEFPLRGVLKCWCGLHMTAGFSKGKKKYYPYYRCIKHTGTNLPGGMLHEKFVEVLRHLSFTPVQVSYLAQRVKEMLKTALRDKESQLLSRNKELSAMQGKIEQLEEKFLNGDIEAETYKRWFTKYSAEKAHIQDEIVRLNRIERGRWERVQECLPKLTVLADLYERASVHDKHLLVKGVFKHALTYVEGVFRTPSINEIFAGNYLIIKEKGLLLVEQPSPDSVESLVSSP